MLARLARYLRAAGYDTALAENGETDAVLLRRARAEGRRFLTRDRRILEHKAAQGVALLLPSGDLDRMAVLLRENGGVDWLHKPFTRCLLDNAVLAAAGSGQEGMLPGNVPLRQALHCPQCGRAYWTGSHHRRMRERLMKWSGGQVSD